MNNMITIPSIYPVTCHTDHVGPGSTFVAIRGMNEDGGDYIPQAVARGACHLVIHESAHLDSAAQKLIQASGVRLTRVADTRRALSQLAAQAFAHPARSLKIVGITGTKGKSTTAFILEHILKTAGYKTALISTVKNRILTTEFPAQLTTPQPDYLHAFFDVCRQQNVEYVIMEVAAQAVSLHRVADINFYGAVFTNFSLEHSEFYTSMDDYFHAKLGLLDLLSANAPLVLNMDDERVKQLVHSRRYTSTFSLKEVADAQATIKQVDLGGIKAQMLYGGTICHLYAPALVGTFNVYNILAASLMARHLSVGNAYIEQALLTFDGVPGRLERFDLPNGATAFIDYAHNPASYQALFSALKPLSSRLIVVFGAGGERDPIKRPAMGALAAEFADELVLTSDNPRSEDPAAIVADIRRGIDSLYAYKVQVELDRELAIKKAYEKSGPGSIIVLLGKGPEEYQLVGGKKVPFSEAALLRSLQKDAIINTI
jgi:UDP-N-acetylmuramoyl-L-alanyl-D-glutamate--2,6-diaminopimelate ligase